MSTIKVTNGITKLSLSSVMYTALIRQVDSTETHKYNSVVYKPPQGQKITLNYVDNFRNKICVLFNKFC